MPTDRLQPDVGLLMVLSAGYGTGKEIYPHIAAGTRPALDGAAEAIHRAYLAPFAGLPDAAYHGLRRFPYPFPWMMPLRATGRLKRFTMSACLLGKSRCSLSGAARIRFS